MSSPFEHPPDAAPAAPAAPRSKLFTVCPFILGNEFCERLAFYGIATNMVIYLTEQMGLSYGDAAMQVSLFSGTCYMTPLLGAWLADCHWGRFKTILVFSMIYCLGMCLLAASAIVPVLKPTGPDTTSFQSGVFYAALYTVALGTGGIKPNVSAFGADQFDDKIRQDRRDKESFFNYFYLAINIGSLIACTVIVGIQVNHWGLGFAIPAVAMALAVVSFVAGYSLYVHQDAAGSPMNRVIHILAEVCSDGLRRVLCCGPRRPATPEQNDDATLQLLGHEASDNHRWLEGALTQAQATEVAPDMLEVAGRRGGYSQQQIDEVRMVTRMFPIFLLTIMYWTIYCQMSSVFVMQGQELDRDIPWGSGTINIPAASLNVFDTVSIVVLIPMYDGIFNPLMKRWGHGLTMLQRIGWGMLVAALAMLMAAVVERRRMAALAIGENISVLEQSTQFLLVGLSEVLASIGQIEFFYDQAPDVMRSCCSALQLLSTALGGYLSAFVLWAVTNNTTWITDLKHNSRLDLYFILLAVVMFVNTLVFVFFASRFQYKVVKHRAPMPRIGGQPSLLQPWQLHGTRVQGVQRPQEAQAAATQAIAISGQSTAGYGYQWAGTPVSSYMGSAPDVGAYGRSVTYMPNVPAMPGGFR